MQFLPYFPYVLLNISRLFAIPAKIFVHGCVQRIYLSSNARVAGPLNFGTFPICQSPLAAATIWPFGRLAVPASPPLGHAPRQTKRRRSKTNRNLPLSCHIAGEAQQGMGEVGRAECSRHSFNSSPKSDLPSHTPLPPHLLSNQ